MWLLLFSLALPAGASSDTLHVVDLYGVRTVSEASLRAAIGLRAGDPVPVSGDSIRARVRALPGVAEVHVSMVCCSETGRTLLYVGIREVGTPPLVFRAGPSGAARLPDDILAAGVRFESALMSAVRRGATAEDGSQGFSLAQDSALRSVQDDFLQIAADRGDTLTSVLRNSADATHRALAAQILAYGANRQTVSREILYAAADPSDAVRNNATRALAVLAAWVNRNPQAGVAIPPELFLDFLNSVSWTDRNKGLMVLMPLTASRDPALLAQLRSRALPSLVEMARWTDAGHALHPFLILARTAGLRDGDALQAWQAGDRESVIARAVTAPGAQPPDDGQGLHVGMVTRAYADSARRSWDRAGPRPLRTAIWYPAPRTAEMTEMVTAGLFIGGAVAPDAPIAGERRYPLILLSHGTGGSAVQMMWLGRFLAANGFVVAAVNHHGNTSSEPERRAEGFLLYWERARDLSSVLDQLLADNVFGPRINVERVGAAGFSLGGFTVLLTGGARFSREQYDAFCGSTRRDFTCEPQPEHSTAHEEFARLTQSDPIVIEALRHSDASYRDPRVKAVFAIAPALGSGLTEASLAQMPVPVAVVVGNRDATTPMATNAARIAALVPGADYAALSDVTHYTFLNACSTRGIELLDLCRDYGSVDRSAIHRGVGEMALAFFRRAFDTGS